MSALPRRYALDDYDHVRSRLVFEGRTQPEPLVTIAIPTFNRAALAVEAVQSALSLATDVPHEILIVDNGSEPEQTRTLLEWLRSKPDGPLRYLVNDANIGMFPNWNRAIREARGRWVTILNDDDLLRPTYLSTMRHHVDWSRDDAAYACDVAVLDQRAGDRGRVRGRRNGADLGNASLTREIAGLRLWRRSVRRVITPITTRQLFWAHVSGTGLGMIFPKVLAERLGGFYPEDHPTADYYFHVRLATDAFLFRVNETLAEVRLQVNESQKPATLLGFLANNQRLRAALIDAGLVPRYWRRFLPGLTARERRTMARMWRVTLSRADVEVVTGVRERAAIAPLAMLWRLWHGAW